MKRTLTQAGIWFALLCCVGVVGCGLVSYTYKISYLPNSTPPQQPIWNVEYNVAFSPGGIGVYIKNNGTEPVNIYWDECAYIDPNSVSHRVLTGQSRLITSSLAQPPTPIAPGSSIQEGLIPADYISGSIVRPLFPANPGGEWWSGYKSSAKTLINKEIGLLIVAERNGEKRKWTYRARIDDVTP